MTDSAASNSFINWTRVVLGRIGLHAAAVFLGLDIAEHRRGLIRGLSLGPDRDLAVGLARGRLQWYARPVCERRRAA